MKPLTKIAAIACGLVALLHIYRLSSEFQIVLGSHEIPLGMSYVAIAAGIIFCIGLWRESKS